MLGTFPQTANGRLGIIAVGRHLRRHKARDLSPVAGNRDLFAMLDKFEQLPESIFGLEGTDRTHANLDRTLAVIVGK
mgnify:FL=1